MREAVDSRGHEHRRLFSVSPDSRAQLCRFVTVCIFTCTGQHASLPTWASRTGFAGSLMARAPRGGPRPSPRTRQRRTQWSPCSTPTGPVALGHHEKYFSGLEPQAVLEQFQEELGPVWSPRRDLNS
ncbi:polyunsaturated fatty acid lipoxygenase ALOX15-like isoform X2 [Felis catus]|uniref:polyunsaturated fatty acid lipoxygenase ALOX15-like isoform X2 n=1 Tax=Felis catus TaxID=9685 RepID=UPI0009484B36|nr:polyunsaturated fatty acid lipoxygenase ALOX15-like isoform X2 [Felis catus]